MAKLTSDGNSGRTVDDKNVLLQTLRVRFKTSSNVSCNINYVHLRQLNNNRDYDDDDYNTNIHTEP